MNITARSQHVSNYVLACYSVASSFHHFHQPVCLGSGKRGRPIIIIIFVIVIPSSFFPQQKQQPPFDDSQPPTTNDLVLYITKHIRSPLLTLGRCAMVLPPSPSPSSSRLLSRLLLVESVSDLITISLISTIVLFSLISLCFIIHFHFKSQQVQGLKNFNSLCSVRVLLVSFISLWALTEFLRLPFTRVHLFTYFPNLSETQQSNICKLHTVLSLGLFEPGFLVTLLFLLSFSIKKRDPDDTFGSAAGIVIALCLPILLLQIYFVFFPSKTYFSELLWRSHVVVEEYGTEVLVLCVYPLFGTIIFAVFGTIYIMYFFLACCKVIVLVINKGLRVRMYALAISVLVAIPFQVLFLVVSSLWNPVNPAFNALALIMFLTVLLCAGVGEGILIIRPILDALAVGRQFRWWRSREREQLPVVLGDKEALAAVGGFRIQEER